MWTSPEYSSRSTCANGGLRCGQARRRKAQEGSTHGGHTWRRAANRCAKRWHARHLAGACSSGTRRRARCIEARTFCISQCWLDGEPTLIKSGLSETISLAEVVSQTEHE
eukprot:scaffold62824_cov35-Tisochrysis_lutea.AAC.1